jgi:DNA-binding GntR family transcriptional regulator
MVSAGDRVVATLRDEILTGALLPGDPLRQDELATRFGLSRIPVREALRALQAENLVVLSANKGATVAEISLEDVLGRHEVRVALETHALRLAIPNMVEDDVTRLHDVLQEYDQAPDPASWSDMNWRFHWSLYEPCDCRPLLEAMATNYGHLNRFDRLHVSLVTGRDRPQKDHYALVGFCEARDIEGAVALLTEHIRRTQRSLVAESRRQRWRNAPLGRAGPTPSST